MPATGSPLVLVISSPVQQVSLLSSLLRTLQAAVRDCAQNTEAGRSAFSGQDAPVLVAATETEDSGLRIAFSFRGPSGSELGEFDRVAFSAFIADMASALKTSPQRTLWGTPVRPLVRASDEGERMRLFLEDLVRLGDVTVAAGENKLVISGGKVEASFI